MSYQQQPTVSEGAYATRQPSVAYGQPSSGVRHRDAQAPGTGYAQGSTQHNAQADNAMAALLNSFTQTHLGVPGASLTASAGATANQFSMSAPQYFYTQDGQLVYAPGPGMFTAQPPMAPTQISEGNFPNYSSGLQYLPQASYPGYMSGYPLIPYTPNGRSGYYSDRSESMHKDVPALENRRGSYSTNESAPGTPYYGSLNSRDHGAQIAAIDRSPIYSTPSPQLPHPVIHQVAKPLPYKGITINIDLDALLQQQPAIPHAVPAVFTPRENMRTLDQSLSNPIPGNRNVYIRGLHPNTDDETLAAYATRFGKVETSKAIIDTSTGACKGFGFAKYVEARDSEMCIRAFYKLGYEVGFARESFNSRLKAEGDESSTNLYVSNLPKSMTESELGAIFMDYVVSSSRILRDGQGQSRGVGFARFESRYICEEVIKKFHGQPIGDEGLLLQVRYADTPAQKDLKRVTTERRQFRTNEYNVGAYGADIASLSPPMPSPVLPRVAQMARHMPQTRATSASWKRELSDVTNVGSPAQVGFKEAEKFSIKREVSHGGAAAAKELHPSSSTPTISEDGSADEGATIHCLSPSVAHGGAAALSSPQKF